MIVTDHTEDEPEEKLLPLPKLKVFQETYCSQEMTDQCIAYLEEHQKAIMSKILFNDKGYSNGVVIRCYSHAAILVYEEGSKVMSVPDKNNELAYIDLQFELCRRFRTAYGYEVMDRPHGHALAPTPQGPFPPSLPSRPISESAILDGLKQSAVDEMVAMFYREFPEWCYICGEAYRREVVPIKFEVTQSTYAYYEEIIKKRKLIKDLKKAYSAGSSTEIEAANRIRLACDCC